jgi:ABC-type Fe3+-hydroxamate transport system substrate-binding protein
VAKAKQLIAYCQQELKMVNKEIADPEHN